MKERKILPICCLDTSIIQGKMSNIFKSYPREYWAWAITETTDLELNDFADKNNVQKNHKKRAFERVLRHQIRVLLQPGQIAEEELDGLVTSQKKYKNFPFEDDYIQNLRLEFKYSQFKHQFEFKMEQRIKNMKQCEDQFWNNLIIRQTKEKLSLTYQVIQEQLSQVIRYPYPLGKFKMNEMVQKYGLDNIKRNCPSIYNILIFMCLIKVIYKPETCCNSFKINISGEPVRINKSTITDIKISSAILPYVVKFITSDQSLAKLLKFLYPQYSETIHLMS